MPLGTTISEYLKGRPPQELFKFFMVLADGLKKLHDRDITHRDIKPANMLIIDEFPVFSDFGLANFPKKERISSPNESIGAKWTIAPEMQRISGKAEYKKADIYSLAKTLWILITGQQKAFEGQYVADSPISIKRYIDLKINEPTTYGEWDYQSVVLLEKLLTQATSNDPAERPIAEDFVRQMLYWYNSNDDYRERNPYEWENAVDRLFPIALSPRCEWWGAENIVKILNILLEYDSLAYFFLPERGGDHFRSIKVGSGVNEVILNEDIIIRPSRLLFESIEGDKRWSYFRLESEELNPISRSTERQEYLFSGPKGMSADWYPDSKEQTRIISGCIIFTHNTSMINFATGPLDGHQGYHGSVDADTYKNTLMIYKEKAMVTAPATSPK